MCDCCIDIVYPVSSHLQCIVYLSSYAVISKIKATVNVLCDCTRNYILNDSISWSASFIITILTQRDLEPLVVYICVC